MKRNKFKDLTSQVQYDCQDVCNNLINIMIQIGITVNENQSYFKNKNSEHIAKYIINQLEQCGYPTHPCGSTWALLDNN